MEAVLSEKDRELIRLNFGERIRNRRRELGISQEELAFRSGLHRTYVGSVERGERNLSLENIFVFAKSLGCEPYDLLKSATNQISK